MNDMSSFLPARCCAGVGTSYGHVCLSVCVCPSVHYKVGVLLKQANESSWVFWHGSFVPHCVTRSSATAEGPRDASCQLKSCQLPSNSAETTCTTTSPEQIEVMKLEGYGGSMCNKHVHSTMTRSIHFHCLIGVINKPTTDDLLLSPAYRRMGGSVAEWLACWTQAQKGPGSNRSRDAVG